MEKIKIILTVIIALSLNSCQKWEHEIIQDGVKYQYDVIEIEGCEYLVSPKRITHKGNCKNTIHSYKH